MSMFSELNISGIYFIEDAGGIKIGSAGNIETRRTDLQTANSYRLKILGFIKCDKGTRPFRCHADTGETIIQASRGRRKSNV